MNREYYFRAWDIQQKKMVYPGKGLYASSGDILNAFPPEYVMEYAGRRDITRRRRYEGDICINERQQRARFLVSLSSPVFY